MAVTPAILRTAFPEFASTADFPDSQITFWTNIYSKLVGEDRWGELTDLGIMLASCHQLVLSAKAYKQAATGGTPGSNVGVLNSRSVDKVSLGYDVNVATEQGAGFWNQTTYGTRYWHYVQIFGAGPVQANTPGYDPAGGYASGAWPGPLYPIF